MLTLKKEYQELSDEWEDLFGGGSCSCSVCGSPPCSWCENSGCHDGHPNHLDDHPECWEDSIINLRRGYTMTEDQINLDNALQVLIEKKTFSLDSVERIEQIRLEVEELRVAEAENMETINTLSEALTELKSEKNQVLFELKELKDDSASVAKREKQITQLENAAENSELRRIDTRELFLAMVNARKEA